VIIRNILQGIGNTLDEVCLFNDGHKFLFATKRLVITICVFCSNFGFIFNTQFAREILIELEAA
jgi:hypothetical protein